MLQKVGTDKEKIFDLLLTRKQRPSTTSRNKFFTSSALNRWTAFRDCGLLPSILPPVKRVSRRIRSCSAGVARWYARNARIRAERECESGFGDSTSLDGLRGSKTSVDVPGFGDEEKAPKGLICTWGDPRPRRISIKSSKLPPSAHCINTWRVGTRGPKEENWQVSSHAWLNWMNKTRIEGNSKHKLVCNDIRMMQPL